MFVGGGRFVVWRYGFSRVWGSSHVTMRLGRETDALLGGLG